MDNRNTMYVSDESDSPGGTTVYKVDPDTGEKTELDPRLDLANHSPDGFSWGYAGSGPAQLALAILADARGDSFAVKHYQSFKRKVIASAPDDQPLSVSEAEIDATVGEVA